MEQDFNKLSIREVNRWYERPSTKCKGEYYTERVKLKVNWFRFAEKIAGKKIHEYHVKIEKVKLREGKLERTPVAASIRAEIFWKLIRHAKYCVEVLLYDDYETMYSIIASGKIEVSMKDTAPNTSFVMKITPLREIILDFRRDTVSREDIANLSSKFLKCLLTQKFRYVPEKNDQSAIEFTKQFVYEKNAIYLIPSQNDSKISVAPGIEGWMGIYLAIRETSDFDIVVNFGIVDRLFYKIDVPLVEYIISVIMKRYTETDRKMFCHKLSRGEYGLNKVQRVRLSNLLRGLKLKSTTVWDKAAGKLSERHLHFIEFDDKMTAECIVPMKYPTRPISYFELYKSNGILIHYPHMPLVRCKTGKTETLVPIDVLSVHEKPQRFKNMLDVIMKKAFIEGATRYPHIHKSLTEDMLKKFEFESPTANFLQAFNIQPKLKMIECMGKVLKEPNLVNRDGKRINLTDTIRGYQEKTLNVVPQGELCCSLIVLRSETEDKPCIDTISLRKFYKYLIDACIARGIKVGKSDSDDDRSLLQVYDNVTCFDGPTNFRNAVNQTKHIFDQLPDKASKSLIIIVFSRLKYEIYGHIKYICDNELGIANQVVNNHTVEKAIREAEGAHDKKSDTIFWNLALKINGKLDGVNQEIGYSEEGECSPEEKERRNSEPLKMFVGIDVTHPTEGSGIDLSIASIVASLNRGATRYRSKIVAQMEKMEKNDRSSNYPKHREKTDIIEGKFVDLLNIFANRNSNRIPNHIVVFRDGVSDSEMLKTAHDELTSLKKEVLECMKRRNANDTEPLYTYIIIQKRHSTRFYRISEDKEDKKTDGITNITSGTVCDKIVVSPYKFDFWLSSHHGEIGTSRPSHYTVMYDNSGLVMDTCYKMCYELSFLSSRCRKPISLPVPVYYAHLQCTKAKEVYKASMCGRARPCRNRPEIEKVLQPKSSYPGMSFV